MIGLSRKILRHKLAPCLVAVVAVTLLGGCVSGMDAVYSTARAAIASSKDVDKRELRADYRYLRVVIDGRLALLVLGYTDSDPAGPIEVWYSAGGEVLKLQNGRVVGATGLPIDWRHVTLPPLPDWSTLAQMQEPYHFQRARDVMPGYRFNIRDDLSIRPIAAPSNSALVGVDPKQLQWFEEDVIGGALPAARYAIAMNRTQQRVLYAEQCLSPELCFSWQNWPAGKYLP